MGSEQLKFLSKKQRYLMITLVVILFIAQLVMKPLDDAGTHIARIEYLADNIQNLGIFEALRQKIYFGMLRDSGYGYPIFYGDILLYPFAIILCIQRVLGLDKSIEFDAYTIYKMLLAMQFIGVFFSSYKAANKFLKHHIQEIEIPYNVDRKDLQLLIGFLYTQLPYTVLNLSNQQCRIEAVIIIPWVVYNTFEIYLQSDKRSVKRNIVWLAITMSLVILTHLIQAVYVSVVLIVFIIYEIVVNEKLNTKAIKKYLVSAGICIMLVAQFIVPMMIALQSGVYAVSNTQYNLSGEYNTNLLGFLIPQWLYVVIMQVAGVPSEELNQYTQTGYYGFYYLILLVFGIKSIVNCIANDETEQQSIIDNRTCRMKIGLMCIAYQIVYMILNYTSAFSNILEFTQFRYRLNTIFDCGLIYLIIKILLYNIEYTGKLEKKTVYLRQCNQETGLEISEKEINKQNKERKHLVKYLIMLGYITVILQIIYCSILNTADMELSLQVGGGGEYLVYNELYDEYDEDAVAAIQYSTQGQVTDLVNYVEEFKNNKNVEYLNNNGKIREYAIDNVQWTIESLRNTTEKIINNREKETGRKVNEIQSVSNKSLILPINYYPGYKITITSDNSNRSIEVGDIDKVALKKHFIDTGKDFKVSNLGLIQVDLTDSEIKSQSLKVSVEYTGTNIGNVTYTVQLISWIFILITVSHIEYNLRKNKTKEKRVLLNEIDRQ